MPAIDITVSCPVHDSFRVAQVAGMFDVPLAAKATERFQVELPDAAEEWQIGLIVGPSGSGKSTIARHWASRELRVRSQEPEPVEGCAVNEPERHRHARLGKPAVAPDANRELRVEREEPTAVSGSTLDSSFSTLDSPWPADRAVIDCFGELSVRQVVDLFTAVGFGSPPSWVKPYAVLSGGERFRCDLARALAVGMHKAATVGRGDCGENCEARDQRSRLYESMVVFDEFTSVVDRNVAKVCSAAIAKGIRRGSLPCRFVAVTCHYDVAEWLEPDWVLDMATCELLRTVPGAAGGRFRRPRIELEIHRCRMAAWQLFKRHHYLSGSLPVASRCYLTTWNGVPVNFCATVPVIGKRGHRRFTRIVTLPDYQGIGIGMRAVAAVAELHRAEGLRINVTSSHPSLIGHCRRSPLWKAVNVKRSGGSTSRHSNTAFPAYRSAAGRAVVSFEYVGVGAGGLGLGVGD